MSELDLLTGIIDKQTAQLKELDTLAQSIFYEMFGDPENNRKGWKCLSLGDLCNSDLGKTLNQAKDTGELRPEDRIHRIPESRHQPLHRRDP